MSTLRAQKKLTGHLYYIKLWGHTPFKFLVRCACVREWWRGSVTNASKFKLHPGTILTRVYVFRVCWQSITVYCTCRWCGWWTFHFTVTKVWQASLPFFITLKHRHTCYVPNHFLSSFFLSLIISFSHKSLWLIFHFLTRLIMTHYHESLWLLFMTLSDSPWLTTSHVLYLASLICWLS